MAPPVPHQNPAIEWRFLHVARYAAFIPCEYLKGAVAALGIRQRRLYDTRHTYATMCLMAGINVAFIANQLGHTVEILLSTCAEWINSPSDWSELAKLSTAPVGTKSVQTETLPL